MKIIGNRPITGADTNFSKIFTKNFKSPIVLFLRALEFLKLKYDSLHFKSSVNARLTLYNLFQSKKWI